MKRRTYSKPLVYPVQLEFAWMLWTVKSDRNEDPSKYPEPKYLMTLKILTENNTIWWVICKTRCCNTARIYWKIGMSWDLLWRNQKWWLFSWSHIPCDVKHIIDCIPCKRICKIIGWSLISHYSFISWKVLDYNACNWIMSYIVKKSIKKLCFLKLPTK